MSRSAFAPKIYSSPLSVLKELQVSCLYASPLSAEVALALLLWSYVYNFLLVLLDLGCKYMQCFQPTHRMQSQVGTAISVYYICPTQNHDVLLLKSWPLLCPMPDKSVCLLGSWVYKFYIVYYFIIHIHFVDPFCSYSPCLKLTTSSKALRAKLLCTGTSQKKGAKWAQQQIQALPIAVA